jgi:hypothetical protein
MLDNLNTFCLSTEVIDPIIFVITIAVWLFMLGAFIGRQLERMATKDSVKDKKDRTP